MTQNLKLLVAKIIWNTFVWGGLSLLGLIAIAGIIKAIITEFFLFLGFMAFTALFIIIIFVIAWAHDVVSQSEQNNEPPKT